MINDGKVNILLVNNQPRKLLSYEVVLRDLEENLIKVSSASEALEQLLKSEIAVILIDACMQDLDGFQLVSMIREHPRFEQTAIIFVSDIHLNEVDFRRGYEMVAVDYVPVPVVPEVLRAKVKVFAELYRKTRALEKLNSDLESRIRELTAELKASTARLLQSDQRRDLALVAGNMGSWNWDLINGDCMWDREQYRIFGVDPNNFSITPESVRPLIDPEDWTQLQNTLTCLSTSEQAYQTEFRVYRPGGELRWCMGTAFATVDDRGRLVRLSGVTVDITDRKRTEERENLLAREADHRARNALAVVKSIVRLTKAGTVKDYAAAVEGRIAALARPHTLLAEAHWQGADLATLVDEELGAYQATEAARIVSGGPQVSLEPGTAQTIAVVVHELATNAAKHGALASLTGRVALGWELRGDALVMRWSETCEPVVAMPTVRGFGIKVITSTIEVQFGGKVLFDWRGDGMDCTLTIPFVGRSGRLAQAPPWRENHDFVTVGDAIRALEDDPMDFATLHVISAASGSIPTPIHPRDSVRVRHQLWDRATA